MEPIVRSKYETRLGKLHDPDDEERRRLASLSPEERLEMVWTLTVQAWAFKEGRTIEPRLRRDVTRVVRSRC